jgi:hypothetical protein
MTIESIVWHDATQRLPDAQITVLCWLVMPDVSGISVAPDADFECGYYDDAEGAWLSCVTGDVLPHVTHWAEPMGPHTS